MDVLLTPAAAPAPRRPTWRFLWSHPAHALALGFGCGLSPFAPGTVGTLWAWLAFVLLDPVLSDIQWGVVLALGVPLAWWSATVSARRLGVADPSSVVVDEVIAFWAVLWLVMPTGLAGQLAAFALFRFFDAVKPGPVGWADRLFKLQRGAAIGWAQGFGIVLDDAVAALCTLLTIALWQRV